jgi:hypothetical protein
MAQEEPHVDGMMYAATMLCRRKQAAEPMWGRLVTCSRLVIGLLLALENTLRQSPPRSRLAAIWGRQSCLQPPFRRCSGPVRVFAAYWSGELAGRRGQADYQSAAGCQPAPHSFGDLLHRVKNV